MAADAQALADEVTREFERLAEADYYEILNVPQDADERRIRERFRELAKRYHADRYAGMNLPKEITAKMTQLLGLISRAHSVLTNRDKRQEYDATLEMKAAGMPTDLGTIVEAETLYRNGRSLMERGLYEAALDNMDQAAELNPAEPEYAATAAYCKYWTLPRNRDGRSSNRHIVRVIIGHLTEFLNEHQRNDAVCVYLGLIAKSEGNLERAIQYFEKAVYINPKNLTATRELRLHNMRKQRNNTLLKRLFAKKKK